MRGHLVRASCRSVSVAALALWGGGARGARCLARLNGHERPAGSESGAEAGQGPPPGTVNFTANFFSLVVLVVLLPWLESIGR